MTLRVREFRFLTPLDAHDPAIKNWSRTYEWRYALDQIRAEPKIRSVHNTCCGENALHRQFADLLTEIGAIIWNSDAARTPNVVFPNFFVYDILDACSRTFDCVLCISALEDMLDRDKVISAVRNLLAQTRCRLIITADHPGMNPEWLCDAIGIPYTPLDETNALTGANSVFRQDESAALKIILLDVEIV